MKTEMIINPMARLIRLYNQTEPGDVYHEAIKHLLLNIKGTSAMSIYDIADICFSSVSTISRLVKKLGYVNFGDFRYSLSMNVEKSYPQTNRRMPLLELKDGETRTGQYFGYLQFKLSSLEKQLDKHTIDTINGAIHDARRVSFYSSAPLDFDSFQFDLIMDGKESVYYLSLKDKLEDVKTLDSESMVIIAIHGLQETSDVVELLGHAKEKGAKIFAISAETISLLKKFTDYSLCFNGTKTHLDLMMFNTIISIFILNYRDTFID